MKRLLLIATAIFTLSFCVKAVTLFPYFCDVAGDYQDSVNPDFQKLGIPLLYWEIPGGYTTVEQAESFLQDVLPFSTETIIREVKDINGENVVLYTSPMLNDATAVIYLYQNPQNRLVVGYDEVR